jgi:hypothetical protein
VRYNRSTCTDNEGKGPLKDESLTDTEAECCKTSGLQGRLPRRVLSDGGHAELLVYLVDEEKDIYIGVHRFAT